MKITLWVAMALLTSATVIQAAERRFSAADVPRSVAVKHTGRVVITNDANGISAFRFFGNIRQSLFSLRSIRKIMTRPFGNSVFDSNARLDAQVPPYLQAMISDAARTHGVDPRLVAAVARRESAFNPNATSRVGAGGIMQLMPATAKYLGVSDLYDARQNVYAGARYLRTLLDTFNGDLDLTLAAYNAGPGAVQKYKGIPPYPETQAYVVGVRRTYEKALSQ